ncbi:hypothetical protein FRC08_015793 [Ceratobasidium sp. 394]|nr:hypothetical protein FRC08_015793 [Ceratobasidium sp. 394]
MWLKTNNKKYYGDIEIDPSIVAELLVDGVPDAIQVNLHHEEDDSMVSAEIGGYVPDTYVDDNVETEVLSPSECPNDNDSEGADVVPLQYLGIMDNDLSKILSNELANWGLQNMWEQGANPNSELGYAIRHGAPVNTYGQPRKGQGPADPDRRNYWEATFASLYPRGIGDIESDRPVQISFTEHVRWALQYHDRRFRYHNSFIFVAFVILQHQQALISAKVQIKRPDFDSVARTLSSITPDDLRRAAEEEERGQKPSNPAIQVLKQRITATSRRVMASGAA